MSVSQILQAIGALGGITLIVVATQRLKRWLKMKLRRGCNRRSSVL